jgi:S-adenosylmethionine hydrolase
MSVVSLLSDFGTKDPYVAEMKAAILSISPQTRIVDITHQIPKFDIRTGAYVLASAAPYFPPKTVHVAVVDPGVGTKRRPIIVETSRGFYVGPDNGLLMLAAQKEEPIKAYTIDNPKYMLPKVSKTFHGRDIFAPAAAHLTNGTKPSEFGPQLQDYVIPSFVEPQTKHGKLAGEVLHVDDFGNIISNITAQALKKMGICRGTPLNITLANKHLTLTLHLAYGEVPAGTPLALTGSSDFLEVALNQGNAQETFEAKAGDPFVVSEKTSD